MQKKIKNREIWVLKWRHNFFIPAFNLGIMYVNIFWFIHKDICTVMFTYAISLQCEVCVPAKGFHTKTNLREHMNVHSNERPHKCKFCGVGFNSAGNRFAHERSSHLGIKRKKWILTLFWFLTPKVVLKRRNACFSIPLLSRSLFYVIKLKYFCLKRFTPHPLDVNKMLL